MSWRLWNSIRFRREVFYNLLIEFGIPMKLVRLIKMCLNEICSGVLVGKNLSDMFSIRNGLKQGDALLLLLFNFVLEYTITRVQEKPEWLEIRRCTSSFGVCWWCYCIGWKRTYYKERHKICFFSSKVIGLKVNWLIDWLIDWLTLGLVLLLACCT
jgi:hypothetical protein